MKQKFILIDLSKQTITDIEYSEDVSRKYIGGRGMGVYSYIKTSGFNADAFDQDNALVFSIGPLVGTTYPTATRISLVSKSPLTNTISSSNMGGRFAPMLRKSGYSGLIITGKLKSFGYLFFNGLEFKIENADELKGKKVKETETTLKNKYPRSEILSIGPAGENLVKFASITHNLENDFARGGLGAVMGSKNLKAIVIERDKSFKYNISDKKAAKIHIKKLNHATKNSSLFEQYTCVGTNLFPKYYKKFSGLTVNNFTKNTNEMDEALYGENLEIFKVKHTACYGCMVACRHHYKIDDEMILTPEFESVQLLGPNIGLFDPTIILPLSEHITDIGLDSISAGHIMSALIYLVENNKIDIEFTRDKDRLIEIFDEIAYAKTDMGKEMAKGAYLFASKYKTQNQVAQVKGMGFSAYEPRALSGQGLGYGISSRGADHLNGGASVGAEALSVPVSVNPKTFAGKGKLVGFGTSLVALIDSIGTCVHDFHVYIKLSILAKLTPEFISKPFTSHLPTLALPLVSYTPMNKALRYVTGYDYSNSELSSIARRILTLERIYNNKMGFNWEDDLLPEKFYNEETDVNKVVNKKKYIRELKIYYKSMGWTEMGIPTDKTIHDLSLDEFK